jgi:hypothetical protein
MGVRSDPSKSQRYDPEFSDILEWYVGAGDSYCRTEYRRWLTVDLLGERRGTQGSDGEK